MNAPILDINPRDYLDSLRRHRRMFNLAAFIASAYGLTVDDFTGPCRKRHVAWPRQEFMLAAHEAGYSMPQISGFLNRDHTTILHGIRAARKRRDA
jgi:chromosomal replication initiation ATPase DnaA